jgi:guanylate kinase
MKQGIVFIISGPGGVGKTTLVKKILLRKKIRNNFIRAITATTREKRPGEKEGRDYFFIPREKFVALREKRYFLENEEVAGNFYGTPRFLYERAKKEKKGLLLCIDVKGGIYLKKTLKDSRIVTIFITAPKQVLLERMKKRSDSPEKIRQRMALAKKEMEYLDKYDYVVENCELGFAVNRLCDVLEKELGIKTGEEKK